MKMGEIPRRPSGKRLLKKKWKKSPFFMGEVTISNMSMVFFNNKLLQMAIDQKFSVAEVPTCPLAKSLPSPAEKTAQLWLLHNLP